MRRRLTVARQKSACAVRVGVGVCAHQLALARGEVVAILKDKIVERSHRMRKLHPLEHLPEPLGRVLSSGVEIEAHRAFE